MNTLFSALRHRYLTLSSKILIIFVLLISVPLSVQGIVTFLEFSGTIERRTTDYAVQIVGQINASIDKIFTEEKQKLSLLPLYNPEIVRLLKRYGDPANAGIHPTSQERSQMFHYLAGSSIFRPEIRGIHFITNNGDIFTDMDPYLIKSHYSGGNQVWYRHVAEANGEWLEIPQHYPDYLLETTPKPYVSLAKVIIEPGSMEKLGIVKVDFRLDVFSQVAEGFKYDEIGSLFILNADNELFYQQNTEKLRATPEDLPQEPAWTTGNGAAKTKLGGTPYLIVTNVSSKTGLKVVSLIPRRILIQETLPLRKLSLWIGGACLLAATLSAFVLSKHIGRPLIELRNKMKRVQQGDFMQRLPATSRDEFGQLARGFNRMSTEIERLMGEVYEIGSRERDAEIAALLSQMNPHFMYNSLESINMKAIQQQQYDISDMISALGSLLHYTIDVRSKLVPLHMELAFIESYIYIQQLRFGPRLSSILNTDPSLGHLRVPKLLLQPLIENAINHGIEDLPQGGTVWIDADSDNRHLRLTVRDNGRGMSKSSLERLRALLEEPERHPVGLGEDNKRNGVALRNLNRRLKLLYGQAYGLHVESEPGNGACFSILLPLREEGN
ncbi:sensor histidine kinase [Cohnella fermenti]|uniref:histidine kinase n=1 Tax=Cohnella fermenti TaxID=2565925 RepID=A0A4S4BL56_9BACL|nr:sensor histidine kinase [Cohnella fermenti]THF75491.1 sensor histidine kinase [Cohnella fermenti]